MYTKRLLFCVLLIAGTNLVHAQEPGNVHPSLTEKFVLDVGVFFPSRNFEIHVNGNIAGGNETIDFENEFGLNKSDETFAIDFGWRFGKKWSLLGHSTSNQAAPEARFSMRTSNGMMWYSVRGPTQRLDKSSPWCACFSGANLQTSEQPRFRRWGGLSLA